VEGFQIIEGVALHCKYGTRVCLLGAFMRRFSFKKMVFSPYEAIL
jgi:hypothetical protein